MTTGLAREYTGCASARLAVSLVLDCEAEEADVHRLASHLRTCARCRRFACDVAGFTRTLRLHAAEPRRTAGSDKATERGRSRIPPERQ
jgi:predicted anti-sigma-YlaC factor YlaD